MTSLPDDAATGPDVAAPGEPSAPPDKAQASPAVEEVKAPTPSPLEPPPKNALLYTVFGLMCTGIALWLVLAWSGYKEKYSQQTEGWRLGATRMIEVTLIREDRKTLACSSERSFGDVHCGFHMGGQPFGGEPEKDPNVLQPFNTIKNELFLAAGLWQTPILSGTLPAERFTVVCNYHVVGVLKAVSLRWSLTGSFSPVDQSVAVGTVSDCVIPQ